MVREEIKNLIKKTVKKTFGIDLAEVEINRPAEQFGDYATNVAMILAQQKGQKAEEVASFLSSRLREELKKGGEGVIKEVMVAGPGFINFFIDEKYFWRELIKILKERKKYGSLEIGKNKKIQVEFISANPTGPLTVGNGRGGPFGDVLANVLGKAGYRTERAYYINDYGGQILALGHSVLKDSEAQYKGEYLEELQRRFRKGDPRIVGEKAARFILEKMIKKTIARLGIKYDKWISEKKLHQKGEVEKVLKVLDKKGLLYEKEGALWFKSSQFGDQRDRVVVKSGAEKAKTYLLGDIALHRYKFEKRKFDKAINIWGADHYGDVPGLQAGVAALGYGGRLEIILLQFVTVLEKGKPLRMSKRKGVFVTMDELLDEVGKDAVRFFFLGRAAETHLVFDLDLAKEQSEKNPVYYVQYAYARICRVLEKAGCLGKLFWLYFYLKRWRPELLTQKSELLLIKQLAKFPEVVEETAKDYQVQRLPQYALELAAAFHRFYDCCRIISAEKELSRARLGLVLATKFILKNTLALMGISTPEKM